MNTVDIVTVNYKSTSLLIDSLNSIYKTLNGMTARIFLEDNGSDDDVKRIKTLFPEVVLTENHGNMGFAKAANNGIQKGQAPYVLLLNPDSLVLDGFFETTVSFMELNPAVGILGSKILNADLSIQGSARSFPTPLTAFFGRNSLLSRWFPGNRITRRNLLNMSSDGKTPMSVDWVSGACMMIRRNAIEATGLLDEQFFMYWEDADLCRRMKEKGWKIAYLPSASIIHFGGVSSDQVIMRSILEFHKSSYRLFYKYSQAWSRLLIPLVICGLALRLVGVMTASIFRVWLHGVRPKKSKKFSKPKIDATKKTKILTVISRLNIGGPSIHVSMVTKGLSREKFDSFLVTGKASSQEGDMSYLFQEWGKELIVMPTLHREIDLNTDLRSVISLYRLLREMRPDIVDTHTAKAGFTARIAVFCRNFFSKQKIFTVHTFHGNVFRGYFSRPRSLLYVWIERILGRFTDIIIALGPAQKKELVNEFHIASPEKIKTVPLGLELEPFLSCRKFQGRFRQDFGITEDTFLIGMVGRLAPIKNHHMFFRAAKIFIQDNPTIAVKFVVVGDGELRNKLEEFAKKEGLDRAIIFCGWMSRIFLVYADLNVLALTSLNEGTPMSIIEAMVSSVPVISTEVGGVVDLIGFPPMRLTKGSFAVCERGIFCKSDDPLGLARAFTHVLHEDTQELEERLAKAADFVKTHYSKQRLLYDMEQLFNELMRRKVFGKHRHAESKAEKGRSSVWAGIVGG